MELLESNAAKNHLLRKSAQQKQELQDEVKFLSAKTEKIVTNVLIVGGALAVTYLLVHQFSKSKSKSKTKKTKSVKASVPEEEDAREDTDGPSIISQIGSALAAQATVFLLDLAKDKLSAFLQTNLEKKAETIDERS